MYNPLPYLPQRFKKLITFLKSKRIHPRFIFFIMGLLATVWFLVRVIPKPSRANYPCMQATAPFMSGFVLYLLSIGTTIMTLKRFKFFFIKSKYLLSFLFLVVATILYFVSEVLLPSKLFASKNIKNITAFTPNVPIGVAQGIFPGRVTWMWDPEATNENCANTSNNNGIIDSGDDAWFMSVNNNELVIDSMIIKSLNALTGVADNANAWDKDF